LDLAALANLLDPAIVFFVLGLTIAGVRSNLEIPAPLVKFFSLYLLMSIGFKGGRALQATGLDAELARVLFAALLLAIVLPAIAFVVLRRRIELFDAAAIAATYGSVSAVTFVTATAFLTRQGTEFSGVMSVALVVMESPAIIMAVLLAAWARSRVASRSQELTAVPLGALGRAGGGSGPAVSAAGAAPVEAPRLKTILHEAFTDGAHLLLIGSMVVGAVTTDEGAAAMEPFTHGLFNGILAFFLLEMGLLVARELRQLRNIGRFLVGFGLVMPLVGAALAIALAKLLGMGAGNSVLLAVLAASASYIVVPAVVRFAIPEAKPSRYFGLALGVTFPVNVLLGIPLYHAVVLRLW
jgi:uncharacterized protein